MEERSANGVMTLIEALDVCDDCASEEDGEGGGSIPTSRVELCFAAFLAILTITRCLPS